MNDFLIYILKSTISISCLFLAFRVMMSKEAFFSVNRGLLLLIIAGSTLIPLINLPWLQNPVHVELIPEFSSNQIPVENIKNIDYSNENKGFSDPIQIEDLNSFSLLKFVMFIYLSGVFAALILLIKNIAAILLLLRKATITKIDGFRVIILKEDISSFVFAHTIVISKSDYYSNGATILSHEKAHIQLKHFYDLIILELAKVIHWFNPTIYWVIRSMREIHEFQADAYTLHSGVDAYQYQLLLIKKCVGSKRFSLVNSFNHCQIKKRITMMNKQQKNRVWNWKVATFLFVLTLSIMAFSKKNENIPESNIENEVLNEQGSTKPEISQAYLKLTDQIIQIKNEGNFIDGKLCSLDEIKFKDGEWRNASNKWILLLIDESIPYKRIDEVRETLKGSYWVVQSTIDSDELIYFAGDVSSKARFKDGKWDNWMKGELAKILGDKYNSVNYRIIFSYIVDKTGKAREGHVIKPCEYPEINKAFEQILSQIPEWYPANRGGESVSVYFRMSYSQKVTEQ